MRPLRGFLSLGMRDVRASLPPVPEDARRWAINRVHAEAQKKWKDAKATKRTKKILVRKEVDKRRRQQKKDGLLLEESPSPSISTDASDRDDEGETGRGPLDHLPDIGEAVPGALASSPALPGGGGGATPGSAVAHLGAEADTPEEQALGKRAISPMGSAAAVEQVAAGQKRPTEVPTLAPLKALKVNPSSTAHWVAEAQAALQRGAASARADPKEPATQGGATRVALTKAGEGAPLPHDGKARGLDRAEVPLPAKVARIEALVVSQARATEAAAPRTIEVAAAGTRAPTTVEATVVGAEVPGTTEANVIAARLSAQEVETRAAEASAAPLVQGSPSLRESAWEVEVLPISSDDTS
ncbi:uncharacterized protein [Miscanthus floridulus]|uniref:uncharacterized protein n=1 Tax=Miscanthus floridulus TaxID=154761 RepID=UPI00345A23A1